ncbi:kinase-like domain-containing protein, partial [Mycena sanguinolenta]
VYVHCYLRERDASELFYQLRRMVRSLISIALPAVLILRCRYIHQKQIVHCDLKLGNLLLDHHRNVIITDFGFANRFEHHTDDLMQTSWGSPCYAAPEFVIYVGCAVDIWSCSVILYAMLTGVPPIQRPLTATTSICSS